MAENTDQQAFYASQRRAMVNRQIADRGLNSPALLEAMNAVPREEFLPEDMCEFAYQDAPLPIAENQTISQPFIVAYMVDALQLQGGEQVLEVGTGSGYAAAVLAEIAGEVFTVERYGSLADSARQTLQRMDYDNVHVKHSDGSLGWSDNAPFDGIIVAAGGPDVPESLKKQLAIGGRLVIPVGPSETHQALMRVTRINDEEYSEERLTDVRFVPLIGEAGWEDKGRETATEEEWQQKTSGRKGDESQKGRAHTHNKSHEKDSIWHRVKHRREFAKPAKPVTSELIAEAAEPIDDLETASLDKMLERIGDSRVVLIGEASHGTSEFYRFRARITRELIEKKGFNFVAVEADWPDASRIDHYVRDKQTPAAEWTAFTRFPTWMWRNEEVREFVDWMREHNSAIPDPEERVGFYGLDLYSMFTSIEAVVSYLDDVDQEAAKIARERYGCLMPWQMDPATYGRATLTGRYRECEEDVVAMLAELLKKRLEYTAQDGARFMDALQNARLITNAEQYYRSMYSGYSESWNLRDQHMFDTLQSLMAYGGSEAKAIVWEHNSHIGDASATDMVARGQHNVGQLCRQEYGDDAYLIGFGTHAGTVAAATDWDDPMEIKNVQPSLTGSWERFCHETQIPAFTMGLRHHKSDLLAQRLRETQLERAIGVIYRPETERASHYFRAKLAKQFDEYVWFDRTQAVTPLGSRALAGTPETYPFGL